LKLGLPVIDEMLDIPFGKTVTYYVDPEVEGEIFLMQTVAENSKKLSCCFLTTNMSPDVLRNRFLEYGWDVDFEIADMYSEMIGADSNADYIISGIDGIEEIVRNHDLLAINSLSNLVDFYGEEILDSFEKWCETAEMCGSVIISNFTAWEYDETIIKRVKELSNLVIEVGGVYHRAIIGQYYGILKADWIEVEKKMVLFKVIKPGGIRAYIPKILVTGPFNAGKSTFVHSISNKAVSVDRLGTTVALDHGRVEYRGFIIDIFGTPGQERFDPILKTLGGEALGVIVVVDSTNPESFPRAKDMLEKTTKFGLPYVIAANKQDLPNALSPDEIREIMKLPDVPIIPMSALKKDGVFRVLDALLKEMGVIV